MSRRASATPYAKALFDVALAEGRIETAGQELEGLVSLITGHAELSRVLTHPAVPPRVKREIVERIVAEAGASAPMRKLLILLADRDRLQLLPELQQAYQARVLRHLRILQARVTTAVPLSPEQAAAITRGFERATGQQVRLTTAVDPAIMGGAVGQLGSVVFDGSVTRQLARFRERLAG